jgi:hypothetical protein
VFIVTLLGGYAKFVMAESIEEKFPRIQIDTDNVTETQPVIKDKPLLETENNSLVNTDKEKDKQAEVTENEGDESELKTSPSLNVESNTLLVPVQQSNDSAGLENNIPTDEPLTLTTEDRDKTHTLSLFGEKQTQEAVKQRAKEKSDVYPRLIGETYLVIENNFLYEADDEEVEHDDWLVNIPIYSILEFSPRLNIESSLLFVLDGEDNAFRYYDGDYPHEGLYIKMAKMRYQTDSFSIFGGRYEPGYEIFGYAPIFFGNYTTNLNLYGQVSAGVSFTWSKPGIGKHSLTGHRFYLDTSRLSGELINDRGRSEPDEYGAGATDDFDNYLVTLNGSPIESISGFRYTLGSGKQVGESLGLLDEDIRFASLVGVIQLASEAELEFSVDFLSLKNDAGLNEDNESITLGFGYSDWPTYLGLAYSKRFIELKDTGEETTDRIVELVWRLGLTDNSYLEGAFEWLEENGSRENAVGLAWKRSFDWPKL